VRSKKWSVKSTGTRYPWYPELVRGTALPPSAVFDGERWRARVRVKDNFLEANSYFVEYMRDIATSKGRMFVSTVKSRLCGFATEKGRRIMPFVVAIRSLADVEVDHVRAQWKTYGNLDSYTPGKHHILTFNKISPIGLQRFPSSSYEIFSGDNEAGSKSNAHAILLRSHKLKEEEVSHTVRAIAR
jgi:hypothetical protein